MNRQTQAIGLIVLAGFAGACRSSPDKRGQGGSMAGMSMASAPKGGTTDSVGVPVDRAMAARLGITFARATLQRVRPSIALAGTVNYAEPRRVYVNAHVDGWVDRLYADYTGKPVQRGDPLLALYSPALFNAEEEYLAARRLGDSALTAGARQRLRLWDVPSDQIDSLDRRGVALRTLVLRAPQGGEIAEKMVTEGQAVHAGDNLFLIADRSVLWVDVAVYEMDAAAVRVGAPVKLTLAALPGEVYRGRVAFIYPTVDPKTRTLTARIEVANRDGQLRPGMYATVDVTPPAAREVTVPLQAVLPTGARSLVFVNRGDGTFAPREVITGTRNDSLIEVLHGLEPGDEIVASATYLLDSESNLASAMQGLMLQMGMGLNMGGMHASSAGADTGQMRGMPMNGPDSSAGGRSR